MSKDEKKKSEEERNGESSTGYTEDTASCDVVLEFH